MNVTKSWAGHETKHDTREIMFYCTLNSKYKNMKKVLLM